MRIELRPTKKKLSNCTILLQQVTFERVTNSAFRIPHSGFLIPDSAALKQGIRNPETETESRKRERNQISTTEN